MPDQNGYYVEADYVSVQDAAGNVLEHKVPKQWIGTDLLPEGVKQAPAKKQD